MAVPSETTVAVGAATEGNCSVLHHVFVQNGTRGIDVTIVTSLAAGRNSNTSTRVPGVHLPSECGSANAQCNTTVVHPEDGNLTLLIPVVGGVLILTYWYDPGSGWSSAPSEPLGFVLEVPGNCNPVAVGYIQDSTLSVLCLNLSPLGIHFRTLLLTLDAADPRHSSLAEIGVYDGRPQPWLSNILLIQVLANCPLLSMVTAVVAFVHGEDVIMAAISQTAPQPFSKVTLLLGDMCPGPLLEYYGGDTFLLRCSAGEALTFDPCHQPGLRVANHSVSIPYPCSTWDVVAWMYTTNNSLVVRFENGTRTQPIILGDMSEARCVNSKDPRFVYRHVNGSVYVVRIQDGHVTMLGTSVCSGPSSSPALCSGLDFTEHKGSFYVGFFDGLTYKMANLSCPGEAPASMGVPFRPDLSTYFVGPDEQSCLCSPQAPTLPPPPSLSQSPSQGTSSLPDTTLSPSSSYSQIQTPPMVIIPVFIVLLFIILFIIAIVIAVLIYHIFCGKTKSKLRAYSGQEESQRAVTTLVLLPYSSHHSSSSAVTEELEQAIPESGSPANGELATPDSGSSELTTPDSGSSANDVIAVPLPEHLLEPNTVPVEENNEVQLGMSMETGQHPFTCTVHDVVQQDHTKGEDRMNDRVDKMNALGTGAMN